MSGTEKTTSGSLQDSTKFTNLDKSDGVFLSPDLRFSAIEEKYELNCSAISVAFSIA